MKSVPHTSSNLRVFGGSSHPELARKVAKKVGVRPGEVDLKRFANRETSVRLMENVRGENVYIIQTGGGKRPNDDLMELLLLINAFKLSAAGVITVIAPFFPYSKRDKKAGSRVPISSKLVADLMKRAGADSVMMLDPHTPQLEGFFNMPTDSLQVNPLFCEWIRHHVPDWEECVILSPDEGGAQKAASVAADLGLDFALISSRDADTNLATANGAAKHGSRAGSRGRRAGSANSEGGDSQNGEHPLTVPSSGRRKLHRLSGLVRGRTVIVVDDMIDTGGTLTVAAEVLRREGANDFYVLSTHGIFSPGAIEAIQEIRAFDEDPARPFLRGIVVSNSIPQEQNKKALNDCEAGGGKDAAEGGLGNLLNVLDISSLVAEFIRRHHYRESISVLSQFMPIKEVLKAGGGRSVNKQSHNANMIMRKKSSSAQPEQEQDEQEIKQEDEIVAEEDGLPAQVVQDDEPDEEAADVQGAAGGDEGADEDAQDDIVDAAMDKRLQRVRKGFRLSSVCWEDGP